MAAGQTRTKIPNAYDRSLVAGNLQALREVNRLSMAELAHRSGVSKAMISKIERQEGNASGEILGKLAEALDVGISQLLSRPAPGDVVLVKPGEQAVFGSADGGFIRRALSPSFPNRGIDIVRNTLMPGMSTDVFPAHKRGVHEYVVVLAGTLNVELDTQRIVVEAGDCLFFDAHVTHQLKNESALPVEWILVVDATRYVRQVL